MKKREVKGLLISVKPDDRITAGLRIVSGNLEDYYNILNCEVIDIVSRRIGKKYYDIICDDMGLLKDDPIPTAYDERFEPALYGNLFIVNEPDQDSDGYVTSLTDEDYTNIWNNTFYGKLLSHY